jgi:hypothetical protein
VVSSGQGAHEFCGAGPVKGQPGIVWCDTVGSEIPDFQPFDLGYNGLHACGLALQTPYLLLQHADFPSQRLQFSGLLAVLSHFFAGPRKPA